VTDGINAAAFGASLTDAIDSPPECTISQLLDSIAQAGLAGLGAGGLGMALTATTRQAAAQGMSTADRRIRAPAAIRRFPSRVK